MFSVTNYIGGIKVIKESDNAVAWIDIYGDVQFADSIDPLKKKSIFSFLDNNRIAYNKN